MDKENAYHVVTNEELLERMKEMEVKMDHISQKMEQAAGAWVFIKIMGSIVIGIAVIWNAAANYFR